MLKLKQRQPLPSSLVVGDSHRRRNRSSAPPAADQPPSLPSAAAGNLHSSHNSGPAHFLDPKYYSTTCGFQAKCIGHFFSHTFLYFRSPHTSNNLDRSRTASHPINSVTESDEGHHSTTCATREHFEHATDTNDRCARLAMALQPPSNGQILSRARTSLQARCRHTVAAGATDASGCTQDERR